MNAAFDFQKYPKDAFQGYLMFEIRNSFSLLSTSVQFCSHVCAAFNLYRNVVSHFQYALITQKKATAHE